MTVVMLHLSDENRLKISASEPAMQEDRALESSDFKRFAEWARAYRVALSRDNRAEALVAIGRQMTDWLDGTQRLVERLLAGAVCPLLFEITVPRDPSKNATAFLDAPWELLADRHGHWAERESLQFCPVRRIGPGDKPQKPSAYQLSTVFMAASPEGVSELRFEDEEAAILTATRDVGMELVVEESGTLRLLRKRVAEVQPDVVHVSCHGGLKPVPRLLLENDYGERLPADAGEVAQALTGHPPRLVFLSACQTAESHDVLGSLAVSLTKSNVSAVLGWAAPVTDHEASQFAALLYQRLAEREELTTAVARARYDLIAAKRDHVGGRSRDWHLARLYLGPGGGGVLATGQKGRRKLLRGHGYKAFLKRQTGQVRVAGPLEFVGRRRQLQAIFREFRQPKHAGVFIHGLGGQGKSSLAARVADRLEGENYAVAVVHGRYDAVGILLALKEASLGPEVDRLVDVGRPLVDTNPRELETVLCELLQGPCSQYAVDDQGRPTSRPVLLIIDDFEQALESKPGVERHKLRAAFVESIPAVIRAFGRSDGQSRLLFTSRHQFTFREDGRELADALLNLPLLPMKAYESRKQAAARIAVLLGESKHVDLEALEARLAEIVETSKGNPGLQDVLFVVAAEDPAACDRCLASMWAFLEKGTLPEEQKVLEYLQRLALDSLFGLLTSAQRELLRACTLFKLPVPEAVLRKLGKAAGITSDQADLDRLVAIGLCDVHDGAFGCKERSLVVNDLVRPLAGELVEEEEATLAKVIVRDLFEQWGGVEGRKQRMFVQDLELTRMALLAADTVVLQSTAAAAVRELEERFDYRAAVDIGQHAIACMEKADLLPPIDLLQATAEQEEMIGQMDEAVARLEQAFARIRSAKGEVDEALRLHEEALAVYESLADKDGIANTLWSIAQIELQQKKHKEAREHLAESYSINLELGRLDGICSVGVDFGQLLCAVGKREEGLQILACSRDGFRKLGREDFAAKVQAIIDEINASSD